MKQLDNLVKIKKLKQEPPDQAEFDGMVSAAKIKLHDVALPGLSIRESLFGVSMFATYLRHGKLEMAGTG